MENEPSENWLRFGKNTFFAAGRDRTDADVHLPVSTAVACHANPRGPWTPGLGGPWRLGFFVVDSSQFSLCYH